ncbi:MAG: hypothetical protein IRY99_20140, partial [Isosphaeraceae bacterium]|nr:hypothetical protein [Isosphaeraceae bacterium]
MLDPDSSSEPEPPAKGAAPEKDAPPEVEPAAKGNGAEARLKGTESKDHKVEAAKAEVTAKVAEVKAEAPPPRLPDPAAIAALTAGGPRDIPTFLEGQLPLWYAWFAAKGGETEALRSRRLDLLREIIEVREMAERAAADPRVLRWVRGRLDEGDTWRRKAQDALFASDAAPLLRAEGWLRHAADAYGEAEAIAEACRRALDLVARLQDELPSYGEWMARRAAGLDENFEQLLKRGAELATRVHGEPPPDADLRAWFAKLSTQAIEVEGQLDRLGREFRAAVREMIDRRTGPADWREIDALLRVPMIPPGDRLALLAKISSPALTPPLSSAASTLEAPAASDPDPVFWDQAQALAQLEWGLLRLAGVEDEDLAAYHDRVLRAQRKGDANRALDALDAFSDRLRQRRADWIERRGTIAVSGERPLDQVHRELVVADRVARILPAALVADLRAADEPAAAVDRLQRHALLLWQGRRLLQDFAPRHAELLFDEARGYLSSKDLDEATAEAHALAKASLTIAPGTIDQQGRLSVRVQSEGPLPEGNATVLLAHNPALALGITAMEDEPGGGLVPVPLPSGEAVIRTFLLANDDEVHLNPEVFYRGRTFTASTSVRIPAPGDLVKIQARQPRVRRELPNGKIIVFPDQFAFNSRRIYLRPKSWLEYELNITNMTANPLKLRVVQRLGERPIHETDLDLQGHAQGAIPGAVLADDLSYDKLTTLNVTVTQRDRPGRSPCRPLEFDFRKLHPKAFIVAQDGIDGSKGAFGTFYVRVGHFGDPVPVPALVRVKVEPAGSFREVPRYPAVQEVPNKGSRIFAFEIIRPTCHIYTTDAADD